jgi:hypothetical protein
MRRHLLLSGLILLAACGGSTESELGSSTPTAGAAGSAGSSGTAGAGGSTAGSGGAAAGSGGSTAGSGGSDAGSGGSSAGSGGSAGGGGSDAGAGGSTAGSGGSDAGSGGSTAGSGGSDAGAGGSAAGSGGSSAGSGGSAAGAGGSAAGSGGSGQAGSAGQADCEAPADPTKAAVCVSFAPEAMDFEANDPQLDGQGILYLAAYDTAFPDNGPGEQDDEQPIAAVVFPPQPGPEAITTGLTGLPPLRLDGLPSTVYLRALFFDNLEALEKGDIAWGVWFGGQDLSKGLLQDIPINQQTLPAGKGTPLQLSLTALRRLEVTVKLNPNSKPLDGGNGPFGWFAFNQSSVSEGLPIFGISGERCLSLPATPDPVVRGFVVGSGDRFILGNLNDFNQNEGVSGGSILNATFSPGKLDIVGGKVTFAPKAYRTSHSIDLSLVVPLGPGANPPSYTCPLAFSRVLWVDADRTECHRGSAQPRTPQ